MEALGKPQQMIPKKSLVIALSTAALVQFLFLRGAILSVSSATDPRLLVNASQDDANVQASSVVNDTLVWITPKPNEARRVGYEDEWMMDWKRSRYSSKEGPRCRISHETPYDDDLLCVMPGYIPARLYQPTEHDLYPIPRVVFVTWLDRRLGRTMYTSLMTLIHHNPEYEFILFDDDDVNHFLCETLLRDEFAIPIFSRVRTRAMRADIWRLLIIRHYGGVYLDSDISALGKLPIEKGDTAVSGIAGWSHLPSKTGGAFEHWAMAFMPHHPFITEAVEVTKKNLEDPEYLTWDDTPEAEAEDSVTMRLTGPAMYQWTLHNVVEKSNCTKVDNSYVDALRNPHEHCGDTKAFLSYFSEGRWFFGVTRYSTPPRRGRRRRRT